MTSMPRALLRLCVWEMLRASHLNVRQRPNLCCHHIHIRDAIAFDGSPWEFFSRYEHKVESFPRVGLWEATTDHFCDLWDFIDFF